MSDLIERQAAIDALDEQLARMLGIKRDHVRNAFSHAKEYKHSTYVVVEVDDD